MTFLKSNADSTSTLRSIASFHTTREPTLNSGCDRNVIMRNNLKGFRTKTKTVHRVPKPSRKKPEPDLLTDIPQLSEQETELESEVNHHSGLDHGLEATVPHTLGPADLNLTGNVTLSRKSWKTLSLVRPFTAQSRSSASHGDGDCSKEESPVKQSYNDHLVSRYEEACTRLGTVPASYFLRHMFDKHINMLHHGLGQNGCRAIATALLANSHITSVNLGDNAIGEVGARALCEMLKDNSFITSLDISENNLGPPSAEILADIMLISSNLTHLNLSGNRLGDSSAPSIARAITNLNHISHLNLSHNQFAEAAGKELGPAIAENGCLKHLDLSWNWLRREGAVAVGVGLKNNMFLKTIDLSWNGFGVDGSTALGDALQSNYALRELYISNNRITTEGAVAVAKGLSVNESLTILDIGYNPIGSAGCSTICVEVMKNPAAMLKVIKFTNIEVDNDFETQRSNLTKQFPKLDVQYGNIGAQLAANAKPSRVHPMYKLKHYVHNQGIRIVDFFNQFDEDKSMMVSHSEFVHGIKETGINLTDVEIKMLLRELDKDNDGQVNYSELAVGHHEYTELEKKSSSIPMINTMKTFCDGDLSP